MKLINTLSEREEKEKGGRGGEEGETRDLFDCRLVEPHGLCCWLEERERERALEFKHDFEMVVTMNY